MLMQTLNQAQSLPLLPDSNYVVNNFYGPVSLTPTASPFPRRHLNTQKPSPSPDSAIHSTIYSPSQSPVPSRHGPLSGFSSTSLSRNSSDASQHGNRNYSLSSTTSPLSSINYSPTQSPVAHIKYAHHPGYPSPDLPSSPLSRSNQKTQSVFSHRDYQSQHDEDHIRAGEDVLADLAQHSALTTQTGISRHQLINR